MLSDKHIRAEALDLRQSFIVQAPAGSGKTSLLVQRFIKLLSICNNPEECLAITFTKKAAFEMRYRVLQMIEQDGLANSLEHNNIYHKIIINPNRLKILTIDAFCASLTEKMPTISKLGVNVQVAEDPLNLYLEAVEQLFKHAYKSEKLLNHLIIVLRYLDNNHTNIKKLLINMLVKREQWLPLIVPLKNKEELSLKVTLDKNLQIAIEDVLEDLLSYSPKMVYREKIVGFAKQAATNLENNNIQNNIVFCQQLTDSWPQATVKDLPIWRGLAELLLNKDGSPRKQVSANQGFVAIHDIKNPQEKKIATQLKSGMQELLSDLTKNDNLFLKKLQQINVLPEPCYQTEDWIFLKSLFHLLPELVAHLIVVFQEQQQVDFSQIAIAALDALGTDQDPTDIALCMDYKIQHILVDEFQDTSILQFSLLKQLIINWQTNDGRTIFLVGDPMQSIYRFRQADVGLFLIVQQYGIANIKLKNLYLNTNFRSSHIIVNNLNKLFVNVFPKNNDVILGGVAYSLAVGGKLEVSNKDSEMRFFFTDNNQEEADNIAALIKKLKTQYTKDHTVAILVRAKSHINLIINTLQKHDVKFQSNDLESLSEQTVINDLIILTKSILHLHDIIAWLALLKGPLVGLKLADLHYLRENADISLFAALKNYKDNKFLSEDAKIRLNYVLPILFSAVEQRESTTNLSKLLKKTWIKLGGYLFLNAQELNLVEDFFHKLLKINNIINFYSVNVIEDLINNQFVSRSKAEVDLNKVQIMTIHKAKGLEFDTVIVPAMSNKIISSDSQLLIWQERFSKKLNNKCLLFAAINSLNYHFIKDAVQHSDLYEEQRLLYVAMTRAKKNFYGFCNNITNVNKKSFFSFLNQHVMFEPANYATSVSHQVIMDQCIISRRIPSDWYRYREA